MLRRKINQGGWDLAGRVVAIDNWMVREGFLEKGASEPRPASSEEGSHGDFWKSISGRRTAGAKARSLGLCLVTCGKQSRPPSLWFSFECYKVWNTEGK